MKRSLSRRQVLTAAATGKRVRSVPLKDTDLRSA